MKCLMADKCYNIKLSNLKFSTEHTYNVIQNGKELYDIDIYDFTIVQKWLMETNLSYSLSAHLRIIMFSYNYSSNHKDVDTSYVFLMMDLLWAMILLTQDRNDNDGPNFFSLLLRFTIPKWK